MKVLSLLSRKGGSGKSTLAVHWAVEAEKIGQRVVLVDMDPQQSISSWFNKRSATTPLLLQSSVASLKEHLAACRDDGIDLAIIDTVPDIDTKAVHAARISDLVVIPTRPSVLDLEAIGGSVELVQALGKRAVLILTQTPPRSSVTSEAITALENYGLPICPVQIVNRLTFSRALIDGRVAGEIESKGKAAAEIASSFMWMQQYLGGK
jgi:chromosome partitioning protein